MNKMLLWWQNPRYLSSYKKIIFWGGAPLWLAITLLPAVVWQWARWARGKWQRSKTPRDAPTDLPILLVGNIVVGGGGKTPVVAMLRHYLPNSVVLVKNYKKKWSQKILGAGDACLIEKDTKNIDVMDEALLHAQGGDVVLCKNRPAGLALIEQLRAKKKYEIIIADDGFEDYSFQPTLTLLTLQADFYLGNRLPLPMGPLRQFLCRSLKNRYRPPAAILLLRDKFFTKKTWNIIATPVFVLQKTYQASFAPAEKLVAFAGIARPDSFFKALEKMRGHVVARKKFSDHADVSPRDITMLKDLAQKNNARLITTEKDMMRLPEKFARQVLTLPLNITADPKLIAFIKQRLYTGTMKHVKKNWRETLPPDVYHVTRERGTERPFTGQYHDHYEEGMYCCRCCGAEVFESNDKFDSGTGWPSFTQPFQGPEKGMVDEKADDSFFMKRIEVLCKACGAHLGHVFPDGPKPTGMRYCINSLSLDFKKTD